MVVDFTHASKNFLTVKMKDKSTLFVSPPKKKIFTKFEEIQRMQGEGTAGSEEVYQLMAEILSNNKQDKKISADDLQDFDSDDIKLLFAAYRDFVMGESQNPN